MIGVIKRYAKYDVGGLALGSESDFKARGFLFRRLCACRDACVFFLHGVFDYVFGYARANLVRTVVCGKEI